MKQAQRYTSIAELPLTLTVKELACVLSIGINQAYELVRGGQIGHIKIGSRIIIPKSVLVKLLGEDG